MTTTTVAAIRRRLVTVFQELSPQAFGGRPRFVHVHHPLPETASRSMAWLRRFAIEAAEGGPRAELLLPGVERRVERWRVGVVYPELQGLGGELGLEGLEDGIRQDQQEIRAALHDAARWPTGVIRLEPGDSRIEDAGDGVLLASVEFEVEYRAAI